MVCLKPDEIRRGRGWRIQSPRAGPFSQIFPSFSELTLRNAQVRRISWVRRVLPVGARLSGLLVSAAFRPATYSSMAIRHIDAPHMHAACSIAARKSVSYLILASFNSTCLRASGSYFLKTSFSVLLRAFLFYTS